MGSYVSESAFGICIARKSVPAQTKESTVVKLLRVITFMGLLSFLFGSESKAQKPTGKEDPKNAGRDLRRMVLTTPASEMAEKPSKDFPRVYGILMDFPIGDDTATILSSSTGAASLYTTSTFGIIGGEAHEKVREAAIKFVRAADQLYEESKPTKDFSYAKGEKVRFYLLTYGGVRLLETDMGSIENGKSRYGQYFDLGQQVLTELRLITEEKIKE